MKNLTYTTNLETYHLILITIDIKHFLSNYSFFLILPICAVSLSSNLR